MSDHEWRALVRAVLGYAGLKMSYTIQGVSVEEGELLESALSACKPIGYAERNPT